jgi:hypothetical protein
MNQAIEMGDRISYEDMGNPRSVGTVISSRQVMVGGLPAGLEFQVRWDAGSPWADIEPVSWSDLRQRGWRRA